MTNEDGEGDTSVYFGKGVTLEEQVIFANYIRVTMLSGLAAAFQTAFAEPLVQPRMNISL